MRKNQYNTKKPNIAPNCTMKKSDGFPWNTKNSLKPKFVPCREIKPAVIMLGGSPTSVAVPCKFDEIAIPISTGTGDAFKRCAIASAIGATISTVATLSTNAEIPDANAQSQSIATPAVLDRRINQSANQVGTFDLINSWAIMDMPVKIPNTFQLIALRNCCEIVARFCPGILMRMAATRSAMADQTTCGRLCLKAIKPT